MPAFNLRPATQNDGAPIRKLVRSTRINPTGLDWRRFVVATASVEGVIGCGQVKPLSDGTQELASIAVDEEWRSRGVATAIIEYLLSVNAGTLYLTCRASLGSFYQRFGFMIVSPSEMPPYYRRASKFVNFLHSLHLVSDQLLIMKLDRS